MLTIEFDVKPNFKNMTSLERKIIQSSDEDYFDVEEMVFYLYNNQLIFLSLKTSILKQNRHSFNEAPNLPILKEPIVTNRKNTNFSYLENSKSYSKIFHFFNIRFAGFENSDEANQKEFIFLYQLSKIYFCLNLLFKL